MRIIGAVAVAALGASACVATSSPQPAYYPHYGYSQPTAVQGPPGGAIDPAWGYQAPTESYPTGDEPTASNADQPLPEASADPQAEGYVMGSVDDSEIDQTLGAHGEWIVTSEYGRVWRPYATVVGVNFTPYETCGSWLYTDYGWTFSCDWDWGWLPFH